MFIQPEEKRHMTDFAYGIGGLTESLSPQDAAEKLFKLLSTGTPIQWEKFFGADKSGTAFVKIIKTAIQIDLNPDRAPMYMNMSQRRLKTWSEGKMLPEPQTMAIICREWIVRQLRMRQIQTPHAQE